VIKVRFAPSPTGALHLGGLRTALYCYAYARANNGKFILRIEDTDNSRFVEGSTQDIISILTSFGLDFDEGPFFQSERLSIYKKYIDKLVKQGDAYYCFCSKNDLEKARERQKELKLPTMYDGRCRDLTSQQVQKKIKDGCKFVIRLKMPKDREFIIFDKVHGKVKIASNLIDDQIILKSDGFPTYHLAVVVDDHLMKITHVIRGQEWLYSTPKHIFLYEALGWKAPVWVHLPLILNENRAKLSKREGDFSVRAYLDKGYLPRAILNFVSLLGWHPKNDKELFSLKSLCKNFSLNGIGKAGAIFDEKKLEWMNGQYIRGKPLPEMAQILKEFFLKEKIDISDEKKYLKVIETARDHIVRLPQIVKNSKMFYENLEFDQEDKELLKILKNWERQKICQSFAIMPLWSLVSKAETIFFHYDWPFLDPPLVRIFPS